MADHTSVGQFIEKRFGVVIPAISPWHRAIASDLVSAFDFKTPNDPHWPEMPDTSDYADRDAASRLLPVASPPETPKPLFQELGSKFSRALPYRLNVEYNFTHNHSVELEFHNRGQAGVVFHVYDLHRLEQIPRRYTVEAGKHLTDNWEGFGGDHQYDLEIFGPNGFFRKFRGQAGAPFYKTDVLYHEAQHTLEVKVSNASDQPAACRLVDNAYGYTDYPNESISSGGIKSYKWDLRKSGFWYDFALEMDHEQLVRLAGRMEIGRDSISDPAMGR